MYYYAHINESNLVDNVYSSEAPIVEDGYIEITEEQYNTPIIQYLYHSDTNTFEEWWWSSTTNEINYPNTLIMLTTIIDNLTEGVNSKADATHNHDGAYSVINHSHSDYANIAISVASTLASTGWEEDGDAHKQVLTIDGITSTRNGVVGIAQSATDEQCQQAASAMLRITAQGTNQLTIKALGEVPTVNIPLEVILL